MSLVSMGALLAGARSGRVVSFPTDTVPALGVLANCATEIFRLKQREKNKPLILMGTKLSELLSFINVDDLAFPIWQQVATKYWPGGLTLVLPANKFGQALNPGFTTLGIRVPDCSIAIAILEQTGPLLTTSANKSGEPPLRVMSEIANYFPEVLALGDSQAEVVTGNGLPSTVIEWINSGWQVRRQGQVAIVDL